MNKLGFAALAATGVLAACSAHAESFRCGQWIASTEMTVEELLEKCGEPTSKSVEVVDITGPNVHGSGNVKRGTMTVETWTYDRGSQAQAMVVRIEDGKIKSMERAK
jgi:hypothetical protein